MQLFFGEIGNGCWREKNYNEGAGGKSEQGEAAYKRSKMPLD